MPIMVGLLKSHKEFVSSINGDYSVSEYNVERLLVEINDEKKGVEITYDSNIELPVP